MRFCLIIPTLLLCACLPKSELPDTAPEVKAEATPSMVIPGGANGVAFAKAFAATSVTNFSPGSDALTWDTVVFLLDGTWNADATLDVSIDTFPCNESGDYSIESIESKSSGIVELVVNKTSCPTREAGKHLRFAIEIEKNGEYTVSFR